MSKIKVTELFYSVQGEGRYTGAPSVFLRTFGCNFQCRGFNMPLGSHTDEPERIIASTNMEEIKTIDDMPLSNTGCDSYVSWHPKLKHLSPVVDTDALAQNILDLTPNSSMKGIHLVITGGEPLLGWQRAYPDLIDLLLPKGLTHITFETNGTQPINSKFYEYLTSIDVEVHFSVSAKLPQSGESWDSAIKPEVVSQYNGIGSYTDLKFVVDPDIKESVQYVEKAVVEFGDSYNGNVFVMSEGGTLETYSAKNLRVAEYAMERGFFYSPRLQSDLFGNGWAT